MRAVADHRQQIHVVRVIVGQVRDWSESRLAGLVGAEEQSHRAIAEQHRLDYQCGLSALFFKLGISNFAVLAHPRDFAKAVVFVAEQRSYIRRVRFRHQHDCHFSRVRGQVPLRDFD